MARIRSSISAGLIFHFLFGIVTGASGNPDFTVPLTHGTSPSVKIGLALSGGGARGIAHVGVLKWFEAHRIPVDAIAGTSIGGLIGGLYAMGMSPGDIQSMLREVDWDRMFSEGPTHAELPFRRKEDRRANQVNVEAGLKNGFSLPSGLNSAHYIGLTIDRVVLPYGGIASFDDLPIPFRCVATDFGAAQRVVLKDGSLSTAIRATMAIPVIFPPIIRDGRTLVDGGLLDNIPTDVLREMGPDVVVAVDVGTKLTDYQGIPSLSGAFSQSLLVMTLESDRRSLLKADIIIAPNLNEVGFLDFTTIDASVEKGYAAAEEKKNVLERFALTETDWERHLADRRERLRTSVPVPQAILFEGISGEAKRDLEGRIGAIAGQQLEPLRLETTLTKLIGEGRYQSIGYELTTEAGQPTLLVRVKEKAHAPPTVNFALEMESNDANTLNLTLGARVTVYDAGKYGSEWRTDARVGFRPGLSTEFLFPIRGRTLFIAPRGFARGSRENFFSGGTRTSTVQINRYGVGVDLVYLKENQEWRAGYEASYLDPSIMTGNPAGPFAFGTRGGLNDLLRLRYGYDGQDSPSIPTRGLRLDLESRFVLHAPLAPRAYPQFEGNAMYFHPLSELNSVFVGGTLGTSFNRQASPFGQFTLGGPFRLGPLFGGKLYALGWYDIGGAFERVANPSYRQQLSAGFRLNTRLGPLAFIGAFGEGGRGKFYFTFGRTF